MATAVEGRPAPDAQAAAENAARVRLQHAAGDDFEVAELIGRGGFADVFRATDRRLKRPVALKVLRPDVNATPDVIDRFRREAESIAALRHPHILPIHAIGERDDVVFLVLDHVDGESLEAWLERERTPDLAETARVLRETAAALGAAHRAGIVHRDIKPANVLLDGAQRRVLLGDFGIARAMGADEAALTRTGTFVGTPHYLSPEQAAGDVADHRADLYSFGVLGYRMVTGELPFDGAAGAVLVQHLTKPPRPILELRPECPPAIAAVLHRCLAKSPEERWQSAEELIVALGSGVGTSVSVAGTGTVAEPAGKDDAAHASAEAADRFRRFIAIAGVIALAAVTLDLALTRSVTISALVALGAVATIALRAGRLWVEGHEVPALWRERAPRPESATEEFGRHGAAVQRARLERTRLVRDLAELSNVERARMGALGAVADQVLSRITQLARRMGALDERIGAERARDRAPPGSRVAGSTRMIQEMIASRARIEEELAEAQHALALLAEAARHAGSTDRGVLDTELRAALAAAERCLHGVADPQIV